MKLLVGLGNPGSKYTNTRHNAGFLALDHLAKTLKLKFSPDKHAPAEVAVGEDFMLVKPTTFMNNSGVAVLDLLKRAGLTPADLLVIYDDVDLPVGTFRYRKQGSSGGQNGMKSIIDILGTQDIARIRIGIGKDESRDTADYVLSKFSPDDKAATVKLFTEIFSNLQDYL